MSLSIVNFKSNNDYNKAPVPDEGVPSGVLGKLRRLARFRCHLHCAQTWEAPTGVPVLRQLGAKV